MSLTQSDYLERVLKQAKPGASDVKLASYVRYVNEFLKFFGTEKCFLVGSVAEKTKLTWSKDDGDADFLFVSGKMSIPVDKLEIKQENPSFVWVRGENLDVENSLGINWINTVDGKTYLPATILRDVDPRLFTFLRGIFKFLSRTTDNLSDETATRRITMTRESSRVGLQMTEFKRLVIKDKDKIPELKKYIPKKLKTRDQRRKDKKPRDENGKFLSTAFELLALFSTPGSISENQSRFDHFVNVVKLLLERQREERICSREEQPVLMYTDADGAIHPLDEMIPEQATANDMKSEEENGDFDRVNNDFDLPTNVKVTYKEKSMIDFVPALRVEGRLKCIEEWYNRNESWPPVDVKKAIYDSQCYVIAKNSPLDNNEKDFCLAFNHSELLLSKALTSVQRTCFLLLKAYHKGIFEKTIERLHPSLPLKTFHLKTALYRVLEITANTSMWREENLIEAVSNVLEYLKEALLSQSLPHYFTSANLFVGFEKSMCTALASNIDTILKEPVESLQNFFELENVVTEDVLTDDQVRCIIEMSSDGGVEKEADIVEDVMEDFERGFREACQANPGPLPLKEAMHHVLNIVLTDEVQRRAKKELRKMDIPQADNFAGILSKALTGLAGNSKSGSSLVSTGISLPGSHDNIQADNQETENLCTNVENSKGDEDPSDDPQFSLTHETVADMKRKVGDRVDLGRQLTEAISAFVFTPTSKGDRKSLEGEIKQKGLSYFLDELD